MSACRWIGSVPYKSLFYPKIKIYKIKINLQLPIYIYSLEFCYLLVQFVVVFYLLLIVHPDLHSENLFSTQITIFCLPIIFTMLGLPGLLTSIIVNQKILYQSKMFYFTSHSSLMRLSWTWTVKDSEGASRHRPSSHRNRADIILTWRRFNL